MELSFVELWRATGPLARGVVALLAGMSVTAGTIAADKWLRIRRAERQTTAFLAAWRATSGGVADAARLAASYTASPAATLVELVTTATARVPASAARELHDRTARRYLLATATELRKGIGVLATVGSTAPFVGLFGTVIGIVNAFREIGATGRGGIATVSTGIAEALVTTAVGIMVAIPAVWLFNHLSQRIGRLLAATECAGEEIAVARLTDTTVREAQARVGTGVTHAERVPT
ncbi:MAG: MotA/TolQ/ExbB proton channel family protein [Deltaproteobacteria bacterium]|nr:MotA/TolQ/ExbB proton channel family protein [Deltaproteobacteria bacterium]